MKKKPTYKSPTTYEVVRKQRGDWGLINPVTKVIPNKKKDNKPKHKGREFDD